MQVVDANPRQILFLLWFVSRTNRWAPWRLTFLYQRKLFLLLEASFKDWLQENEETRNPFPSLNSVKNRTTSCRLHSQQKNTKCSDNSHPISDSRSLNLAGNMFFYIRHLLVVSLHLQKHVSDHSPSIGAHHLWRYQTQLVTPKPDGLQQGWMTSIPGCNSVKIGKST